MTGEEIGVAADRLRAADGVLDLVDRPAPSARRGGRCTSFRLLVRAGRARDAVAERCFTETSTIGLRCARSSRAVLPRGGRGDAGGAMSREDGRRAPAGRSRQGGERRSAAATAWTRAAPPKQRGGGGRRAMSLRQRLAAALDRHDALAIAVSGGVDSMTLAPCRAPLRGGPGVAMIHARLARRAGGGDGARAATMRRATAGSSIVTGRGRVRRSRATAPTRSNRCYFCKTNLYDRIRARDRRAPIASGANLDDLGDYRPGLLAAAEHARRASLRRGRHRQGRRPRARAPARSRRPGRIAGAALPRRAASRPASRSTPGDLAFVDAVETRACRALPRRARPCAAASPTPGIVDRARRRSRDERDAGRHRGEPLCRDARPPLRRRRAPIAAAPLSCTADAWMPTSSSTGSASARTGVPEAVLCEPKTPAQIDAIVAAAAPSGRAPAADAARADAATTPWPDGARTRSTTTRSRARRSWAAPIAPPATGHRHRRGRHLGPAGGARGGAHAGFRRHDAPVIADVGVAGLWRLMARIGRAARRFRVIIAVAGMEGALFSVLAGLVAAPVIAVPTSVGYGVAAGGTAALHAALASCAPGRRGGEHRQWLRCRGRGDQDAADSRIRPGLT